MYNSKFCSNIGETSDSDYCETAIALKNCFGCVGLKRAEYCILNKQYSKEEYFQLKEKIIEHMKKTGEWGEPFPIKMSPLAYNETVASEYFPLTKEEVVKRGWKWKDLEEKNSDSVAARFLVPEKISETDESICSEVLTCEKCDKNYKIQKAEFRFYKKLNLPIPSCCPNCRYERRMQLRVPRFIFDRKCSGCGAGITAAFPENRPEKVLCEDCYRSVLN